MLFTSTATAKRNLVRRSFWNSRAYQFREVGPLGGRRLRRFPFEEVLGTSWIIKMRDDSLESFSNKIKIKARSLASTFQKVTNYQSKQAGVESINSDPRAALTRVVIPSLIPGCLAAHRQSPFLHPSCFFFSPIAQQVRPCLLLSHRRLSAIQQP